MRPEPSEEARAIAAAIFASLNSPPRETKPPPGFDGDAGLREMVKYGLAPPHALRLIDY